MTDYIVIINPEILYASGDNPEKVTEKIKKLYPKNSTILVCPRKAAILDNKYIPPKT